MARSTSARRSGPRTERADRKAGLRRHATPVLFPIAALRASRSKVACAGRLTLGSLAQCAKSGSAPTDLLAGYLDDRRHRPCVMGVRRRRHVAAAGRVPVSRRVPVLPASGRLSPMASIRTLGAQACEPLDVRTTRDVQSLRGQCPGGQKAASLTDAAPPLFRASGRRSVLSCGVVSSLVAVEVLVPVAPTLRFPLV
jgi:hypothetical protein